MKKEISKGTQKSIWHMAAVHCGICFVACRYQQIRSDTCFTSVQSGITESQSAQQETLPPGDDFDSVKERVDAANNSTGKEVKSLYEGERTAMQKQASSRLFFSNLKNLLFCILLVVLIVLLIKKGLDFKKLKKVTQTMMKSSWRSLRNLKRRRRQRPKRQSQHPRILRNPFLSVIRRMRRSPRWKKSPDLTRVRLPMMSKR